MSNCKVKHCNSATWNGGGISVLSSSASFTNSMFILNNAGYFGGGLYVMSSEVDFDNCSLTQNIASQICHDSSVLGGGGFYSSSSKINLWNSVVSMNYGIDSHCIYQKGGSIFTTMCTLNILNTLFDNNQASYGLGGAMYILSGNTTIIDSLFNNNFVWTKTISGQGGFTQCAGAIYHDLIPDGHLYDNLKIYSSQFTNNQGGVYGGALFMANEGAKQYELILADVQFDNNQAGYGYDIAMSRDEPDGQIDDINIIMNCTAGCDDAGTSMPNGCSIPFQPDCYIEAKCIWIL